MARADPEETEPEKVLQEEKVREEKAKKKCGRKRKPVSVATNRDNRICRHENDRNGEKKEEIMKDIMKRKLLLYCLICLRTVPPTCSNIILSPQANRRLETIFLIRRFSVRDLMNHSKRMKL